jgi:hypothetical protein
LYFRLGDAGLMLVRVEEFFAYGKFLLLYFRPGGGGLMLVCVEEFIAYGKFYFCISGLAMQV